MLNDTKDGNVNNTIGSGQWVNHQGILNPPNTLFFAAPPEEIGTIQSAHSNNMVGAKQAKEWAKQGVAALAMGSFLATAIAYLLHQPLVFFTPIGFVLGGITGWFIRPRLLCTYVGDSGVTRITQMPQREKSETFLFSAQSSVGVSVTENYTNGVYNGTSFAYTFYNPDSKTPYEIRGTYHNRYGQKISPDSDWYFGQQAEIALLNFLFPQAQKRLMQGEDQRFALKDTRQIVLQPHALVIVENGNTHSIPYQNLEEINIEAGTIKIKEQGGTNGFLGLGQKGIFAFPYAGMPNAKLFFVLLQQKIHEAHQKTDA
jgi:hypothetical protein